MSAYAHDHCWHADGNRIRYDYTSVWIERCCHCPVERTMQSYDVPEAGHGPFASPRYTIQVRELPDGAQPWDRPLSDPALAPKETVCPPST